MAKRRRQRIDESTDGWDQRGNTSIDSGLQMPAPNSCRLPEGGGNLILSGWQKTCGVYNLSICS